jgi:hypothetical protein
MGEKLPIQMKALPFSEADFVGPQDRPKAEWQISMYGWQAVLNTTVKAWLAEGAPNGVLRAAHAAPRTNEGVIYVIACDPEADKAHTISLSPDHRTGAISLYTPLLSFRFKKAGSDQKVIFQCEPAEAGEKKFLVIKVPGYQVVEVDKETKEQAESAEKASAAAEQLAAAEDLEG